MQDEFGSRALADRLEVKLARKRIYLRRQGLRREPALFFPGDRGRRRTPGLFVQRRHSRLRADHRPERARVPRLRRQRHVQEPGQSPGQSHVGLLFIAMHGRPRRLRVNGMATSSATMIRCWRDGRRAADRAGQGACHLPQLPALYSEPRARRAVGSFRVPARNRSSRDGRASTSSRTSSTRASRRLGGTRHSDQNRKEWLERTQRFANPTAHSSIEGLTNRDAPAVWFGARRVPAMQQVAPEADAPD